MPNSKGLTRHQCRELIFKLIFAREFDKETAPADFYADFFEDSDEVTNDYVKETFLGFCSENPEIDEVIEKTAIGWKLSRMSTVTRSALRLAVYEMLYSDVPVKVVINEAIEIIKEYDEDTAPAFANGILNKIAREKGKIADGNE